MSKIIIKNLIVDYPGAKKKDPPTIVINGLNAIFEDGSFNVIIGKSGCGKTTLLKTIIGLLPYDGDIDVDGNDFDLYTIAERNLAYVSQDFALYPHMTIFDNIAFPLKLSGASREEIINTVNAVAEELNLTYCLTRKPRHLSGGQQQRVALARAIVKSPSIYLFDEPLSNVDQSFRSEERHYIRSTVKKYGATAIYVTHDLKEAWSIADKIFVMDDGKIVLEGTPKEILDSDHPIAIELKALMNNVGDIIVKKN